MACNFPITGFRSPDGKVVLDRSGYYDRPVSIACGQCTGCRLARSQAWALRCVHEAQMYSESGKGSCFVTLTYDEQHIPDGHTLSVVDLQKFFRRMRDAGVEFRYYFCGEYGLETLRPHYHGLMFGVDFAQDRIPIGVNSFGHRRYLSPKLSEYWGKGRCELGSVTWQSAAYCSGYIVTKGNGDDAKRKYRRINDITGEEYFVKPEFSVMSRRPGIGTSWFEKYGSDAFPSDFLTLNGRKRRVPKFYDKRLEKLNALMLEGIKSDRISRARKSRAQTTPERLQARDFILNQQRERKGL